MLKVDREKLNEFLMFSSIYFFIAFICVRVKLFITPAWFNGQLAKIHSQLITFSYVNNEQSRLLQFYIPELFRDILGIQIEHAYILQRWLFTFLAFVFFHYFLKKWFDKKTGFAGVLFLAAIMQLSYFNHLQESSPLLLLTFLSALWAIREEQTCLLLLVFVIGGLNNETMLILPLVYFLYHYKSFDLKHLLKLGIKTALLSLPLYAVVLTIRYFTWDYPRLAEFWQLSNNLNMMFNNLHADFFDLFWAAYLYIFLIFNILWVFAFLRFKDKPLFLRRSSLMIPIFIAIHMIAGNISEVRLMLPIAFLIIPMAFCYIFPLKNQAAGRP